MQSLYQYVTLPVRAIGKTNIRVVKLQPVAGLVSHKRPYSFCTIYQLHRSLFAKILERQDNGKTDICRLILSQKFQLKVRRMVQECGTILQEIDPTWNFYSKIVPTSREDEIRRCHVATLSKHNFVNIEQKHCNKPFFCIFPTK